MHAHPRGCCAERYKNHWLAGKATIDNRARKRSDCVGNMQVIFECRVTKGRRCDGVICRVKFGRTSVARNALDHEPRQRIEPRTHVVLLSMVTDEETSVPLLEVSKPAVI